MRGSSSSAGSGPITWMPSNATSTAWNNGSQTGRQQKAQRQRKRRKAANGAAETANMTKEKQNENQDDKRVRGRPGQGPALLHGGTGLCQEGRFQQWAVSLA